MKGGVAMAMVILVLLSFGVTVAMADGSCSNSLTCPDTSNCCSQHGYCGKGDEYCGNGCQNGPCTGGNPPSPGQCSSASPCPNLSHCCSEWGFCGTGDEYCGNGCQNGPCTGGNPPTPPTPPTPPSPTGAGLGDILTRSLYEELFPGHLPFYCYDYLIEAAKLFPEFGTTGDNNTRKREIAAFAAHVTHETSGLTKITEQTDDQYCEPAQEENFPCYGNQFNGRGPLQLSWNYNYGRAGEYLDIDLLRNPDLVATDSLITFKTSLWFWNRYEDNRIPRIHNVITGNWEPNSNDEAANRVPGFGVTILIINGGLECNKESEEANARVDYFKKFCNQLGVDPGANLDCKDMENFYPTVAAF